MTEIMSGVEHAGDFEMTQGLDGLDEQLVARLVDRSRAGPGLVQGWWVAQLTKRLLESTLEGEITDHVGYDKHDPARQERRQLPGSNPARIASGEANRAPAATSPTHSGAGSTPSTAAGSPPGRGNGAAGEAMRTQERPNPTLTGDSRHLRARQIMVLD